MKKFLFSFLIGFSTLSLHAKVSNLQDYNLLDAIRQETAGMGQIGVIDLSNLNLNKQGNVIAVYPKEKVFATVNMNCDVDDIDPHALYQIVVGLEGMGAQKWIFNELGYRVGTGILPFFLEAPEVPGIYNIQFQLEQAYSPLEAMQRFGEEDSFHMIIGKIIVLKE